MYRESGEDVHRWSGQPNGTLVVEVEGMTPGTVLDVGCGEGADAVWLAQRGWDVTAVDISGVAIERARAAASAAGVDVRFVHAPLTEAPADLRTFDLVSAQYAVLPKQDGRAGIDALLGAVSPGGTLLYVHHAVDPSHAEDHGFDPSAFYLPGEIVPYLGDDWTIEVDEERDRPGPLPEDARHVRDVVLRARRAGT